MQNISEIGGVEKCQVGVSQVADAYQRVKRLLPEICVELFNVFNFYRLHACKVTLNKRNQ